VLQEEAFDVKDYIILKYVVTIEGVLNIFNKQCHVELEIYLG
jgi:hypothetical protein